MIYDNLMGGLCREIGQTIKEKFDGASEVNVVADEAKPRIVMKNNQLKRHTHADLVRPAWAIEKQPKVLLLLYWYRRIRTLKFFKEL